MILESVRTTEFSCTSHSEEYRTGVTFLRTVPQTAIRLRSDDPNGSGLAEPTTFLALERNGLARPPESNFGVWVLTCMPGKLFWLTSVLTGGEKRSPGDLVNGCHTRDTSRPMTP